MRGVSLPGASHDTPVPLVKHGLLCFIVREHGGCKARDGATSRHRGSESAC